MKRCIYVLAPIFLFLHGCTESKQQKLLEQAGLKLENSSYQEGMDLLKQVLTIDSTTVPAIKALYKLGFAQEVYQKDYQGALLNYFEYLKSAPDPISRYEVRKRITEIYFFKTGEFKKAAELYAQLYEENADSLEADFLLYRQGMSYFRINQFVKARRAFQKLIEKFLKSSYGGQTRFEIGNTYYMESKYSVAIAALRQVLRHHPKTKWAIEAQFLLGECYEYQRNLEQSLAMYEGLLGRYQPEEVLQMRIDSIKEKISKKERVG